MNPPHVAALRQLPENTPRGVQILPWYAAGIPSEEEISGPTSDSSVTAYCNTVRQLYEYVERVVDRFERY